jgi:hypothetical protein
MAKMGNVEVDQEPHGAAAELQVGQQLRLVKRKQFGN